MYVHLCVADGGFTVPFVLITSPHRASSLHHGAQLAQACSGGDSCHQVHGVLRPHTGITEAGGSGADARSREYFFQNKKIVSLFFVFYFMFVFCFFVYVYILYICIYFSIFFLVFWSLVLFLNSFVLTQKLGQHIKVLKAVGVKG